MAKYSELTFGKVEALVNKIGGLDVVDQFLRGELILVEAPTMEVVSLEAEGNFIQMQNVNHHLNKLGFYPADREDLEKYVAGGYEGLPLVASSGDAVHYVWEDGKIRPVRTARGEFEGSIEPEWNTSLRFLAIRHTK